MICRSAGLPWGLPALASAALLVMPSPAIADCSAAAESFSWAYKAYNDCSSAGKGAQGCAAQIAGYDAARRRLDDCRAQGTSGTSRSSDAESDFKTRFEEMPRPERPEKDSANERRGASALPQGRR